MSDEKFTAIQSSEDIVASCYVPEFTDVGLDKAVQVKPYEGLSYDDSYETIRKFLKDEWVADDQTGFEIVYDHEDRETKFNLLRDTESDNKSLDNFANADIAEVGTSESNPFDNLTKGSYVAGGTVNFEKDYWHALLTGDDFDRDPLQNLITEISQNGDSEVTTVIQLTATKIDNARVKKRYPLIRYIVEPIKLAILTGTKVSEALVYARKNRDKSKESLGKLRKHYQTALNQLTGYSRKDFLVELSHEKESISENSIDTGNSIEGAEDKDPKSTQSNIDEAMSRVRDKADRRKFAVQMRVLVIGEDKEMVESRADDVTGDLNDLYSTEKSDASVQQRLTVNPVSSRNQLKELVMDIGQRKTATNVQNKLRDKEGRFRLLHKKRSEPMIMSRDEIASIMHMPSEEVTDRSVSYGKESVSGRVPDY
jgi:hypothetical protein